MSHLIIDIETFALDDAVQFIEEPTAPANYRDPEKIAAYVAEARTKAVDRCALDVDLCRIVAIGLHGADGPFIALADNTEASEIDTLEWFWKKAQYYDGLCGFNILGFDLPVLIRRSQYLGLAVPRMVLNLDKYRTTHIDLMERLSFNGKLRARSLSFYSKRFGISVPDDTSGKDIAALVKANDWSGVEAHCRADVEKTRQLAERLGVLAATITV